MANPHETPPAFPPRADDYQPIRIRSRPNFGGAYSPPDPAHMTRAERITQRRDRLIGAGCSAEFAQSCAVREIEAEDAADAALVDARASEPTVRVKLEDL